MTKHVMSIVYAQKIEPVMDGRCSQTIRAGHKVSVGDEILFHTWDGKPYSKGSKWNNLKRGVVTETINICISKIGLQITLEGNNHVSLFRWCELDILAALDFIDPPTGEALRDVLFKLNGIPKEPVPAQIIRW